MKKSNGFILGVLALALTACEEVNFEQPQAAPGCQPGVAQILITDVNSKRVCGCVESSNTVIPSGQALECTVAQGSVVFFNFVGLNLRHQIISVGTPGFQASPVFNPTDSNPERTYGFVVNDQAGPYVYRDQFNPSIMGEIRVAP